MVATFNGWDELPEAEREELAQWELQSESRPAEPVPAVTPK
jgi:hypothetical protein